MRLLAAASTVIVALGTLALTSAAQAGIGFLPGPAGFDGSITNADGSPDVQAGSHPYQVTTIFIFRRPPTPTVSCTTKAATSRTFRWMSRPA